MDTSILEDIGLKKAEIQLYLALLELGLSTAGPLLKKTGLQNSAVHLNLGSLVGKGVISYIKKGKRKYYQVNDPKQLVRFIENKKKKFESILPELLAKQAPIEQQEAEIYEGVEGLKAMAYKFIEDAKAGDEYLYFSFNTNQPEDFKDVFNFYKEFEKDRIRFGLKLKGIVPSTLKKQYVGRQRKNILFVDFPTLYNISIFRNKVFMTPWEDRQISFLITSKQLAMNFRQYFYSIWDEYQT